MVFFDRRAFKSAAAEVLQRRSREAMRLVLWYGGITALVFACLAAADFSLQQQIANTSGLSGLGTRSILETVQQVLLLLAQILPIFWGMGYISAALKLSRGAAVDQRSLLQGFREFGPVLRLMMLETLIMIVVVFAGCMLGVSVLMATPLGTPFLEAMVPMMAQEELVIDQALLESLAQTMVPLEIGGMVVSGILLLPVMFRLRFAEYLVMDDPASGAIMAMLRSFKLTKYRSKQLLGLDVSFWWYYLATVLVPAAAYGDVILGYFGISIPMTEEAAYFLFLGVGLALQLAVTLLFRNRVELTWIQVYEQLRQAPAEQPKPRTAPQTLPWNEPPMR